MSRRDVRAILAIVTAVAALALTAPAAGAAAWAWAAPVNVSPSGLSDVTCAGTGLCVAVDMSGRVLATQHPSAGAFAWTVVATGAGIGGVACPSTTLCVATAGDSVLVSTDPLVSGSWHAAQVDAGRSMGAVSCPSTSLCIAIDQNGNVVTSRAPTAGAASWTVKNLTGPPGPSCGDYHGVCPPAFLGITCPSAHLCLAPDDHAELWVSEDPAAGTWRTDQLASKLSANDRFTGVSCPSADLCLLSASYPWEILTSHDPFSGPGSWSLHVLAVSPPSFATPDYLDCPATTLCLAWAFGDRAWASGGPTETSLIAEPVDPYASITGVACPTLTSCLVIDDAGNVVTGMPGSAPATLHGPRIHGTPRVGTSLRGARGTWAGTAPIGYLDQWQRCMGTCVDIAGATALRYRLRAGDEGARLRLVVTADNIIGRTRRLSGETARVRSRPRP
jgi:hypothetical protein